MLQVNKMGIFVYDNLLVYPSGDEDWAEDVIEKQCFHFNADALLTLKDLYVFNRLSHMPLEWVAYTPIDAAPVSPGIIHRLRYAFKVVSMSRFGYKELKSAGIDSTMIPHGVADHYRPPEDRETDRETCRRRFHIRPSEFVIGFVGMNRIRKMVPRAIEVLKATREMNPDVDVKMFLWTDIDKETPLRPIILNLGLNEHIHWPEPGMYRHGIPENLMPDMYGAFDLTLCVSGEGFYMPGLESLACGVPIVVPDYASAPDRLGHGCGYKVKVRDWTYNNPVGVRQPLVDLTDAAKKITKIINGDRERYARSCVKEAEKWRWSKVIEKYWIPFLDEAEEELRPLVKEGKITKWDQEVS